MRNPHRSSPPARLVRTAATWLIVSLAVVACGSAANRESGTSPSVTPGTPASTPVLETPIASTVSNTGSDVGPTGRSIEAKVVRVVDGDTIVVAFAGGEQKVRYIGMDTPETKDPNSAVQWMGPEASAANAALVAGRTVILETDVSDVDRYDRLLRYVWLTGDGGWTLVNVELVRLGYASLATYPPDIKYVDLIRAAEQAARESEAGLWAADPPTLLPPPTPLALIAPGANPTPQPSAGADCHPSYEPCLPIRDDLDCVDVRSMGKGPVRVVGPDLYRLDRDGDGLACE